MSALVAPQQIDGHRLRLRLGTPDDAAYIYSLRQNPSYNKYLSPVTGTVDDQRSWLESYKKREAAGEEYYYVSERLDNETPCGVVRLYNITRAEFTWGSWILDSNKPSKGALESALLSFDVGFNHLGCDRALVDVRQENTHAIAFYRGFGMEHVGDDYENKYFIYRREIAQADRLKHLDHVKAGESL